MLSHKDLYKEINNIETEMKTAETVEDLLRLQIKASTLSLKLLHNIRANQVATMRTTGVELIAPADREFSEKKDS